MEIRLSQFDMIVMSKIAWRERKPVIFLSTILQVIPLKY